MYLLKEVGLKAGAMGNSTYKYSWINRRVIFLPLILTCVNSADGSRSMLCSGSSPCESNSLCCENPAGKQWCCPRGHNCCSQESGCCPQTLPTMNFLLKAYDHYRETMNFVPGTAKSKHLFGYLHSMKLEGYQKCEKEGKFICGHQETCCKVGKNWECCRHTNGTCSKDGNNCHPSETTCDSSGCKANEKNLQKEIRKKYPTSSNVQEDILCPDFERLCLDTNTCCPVSHDSYGCCPYEDAVCCSDWIHCCPPDTVCNLDQYLCEPLDGSRAVQISSLRNLSAFMV